MVIFKALIFEIVSSQILPSYCHHALAARGILHINNFSLDFSTVDAFVRSVCRQWHSFLPSSVSDVCLKRICSLDTSTFSTLEVPDDDCAL